MHQPSLFEQHREAVRNAGGHAWDAVADVGQEIQDMRLCQPDPVCQFIVLGRAQQRGSKQASLIPKRGGGWVEKNGRPMVVARDDNEKSKAWMQEVRCAAAHAFGSNRDLLTGPIELTVQFYFKRPNSHYGSGRNANKLKPSAPVIHAQSPDLAKLLRSLEDALTGVVWRDDKQVFRYGLGTERRWTEAQECTVVIIREYPQ